MTNNPFALLNKDLLLLIALESGPETIAKWSQTDKRTKTILEDENLWKNLLVRDFNIILQNLPEGYLSYKQYYIQCYSWTKEIKRAVFNQKAELSELQMIYSLISPKTVDIVIEKINASTFLNLQLKQKLQAMVTNYQERTSQEIISSILDYKMIFTSFKNLAQNLFSLYEKNNLIAGFEFVKLFARQHAKLATFVSTFSIDSSTAYEIGIGLIDQHFRANQVRIYLRQILEGPGIYSTGQIHDRIRSKKKFMFNESLVKNLVKVYPSKISREQVLRLPQQDIEVLMEVYLPFLINCSDEKNVDKQKYQQLLQDLKIAITANYQEELTAAEFHALLGLTYQEPIYFDALDSESEFEEEIVEDPMDIDSEESDLEQNEFHQFS